MGDIQHQPWCFSVQPIHEDGPCNCQTSGAETLHIHELAFDRGALAAMDAAQNVFVCCEFAVLTKGQVLDILGRLKAKMVEGMSG